MGNLKVPRLISDGMVIQQKKKSHIWGTDMPGRCVMISFLGEEKVTVTDENGDWEQWLEIENPGGPYTMQIHDDAGEELVVADVYVGDVWFCSGQSNMELSIERVRDEYEKELEVCKNPAIRTFKITEYANFHGPLKETLSGEWKGADKDSIGAFSATAYFFAKEMYTLTNVPVGLIDASLGGSRIESWMSREMLEGYENLLLLVDKYAEDDFMKQQLRRNEENIATWHHDLDSNDCGVKEHWERKGTAYFDWKEITLPCFFRDTDLKGIVGSIWFERSFTAPPEMVGKEMKLWLGTMVDSDVVYVNGVEVGRTEYQYPPRKYKIPKDVLTKGENIIVIRLKCENGEGRITPGKPFMIFDEAQKVELAGTWRYKIGAECKPPIPIDFVNWKPTGLYNGMTAPCHAYTIAGILWYQGEANAHMPECMQYAEMMERMVAGYRSKWQEETLPFYYVQLPNFQMNLYYGSEEEKNSCWAEMRHQQYVAQKIPNTGMAVSIDAGEDNDLHPVKKKIIGSRLAMLAAAKIYGSKKQCSGPRVENGRVEYPEKEGKKGTTQITLFCKNCKGGMYADAKEKDGKIRDFEVMDANGKLHEAQAVIDGEKIRLIIRNLEAEPVEIRYCYHFTNKGALIYNKEGFPMSPFRIQL